MLTHNHNNNNETNKKHQKMPKLLLKMFIHITQLNWRKLFHVIMEQSDNNNKSVKKLHCKASKQTRCQYFGFS